MEEEKKAEINIHFYKEKQLLSIFVREEKQADSIDLYFNPTNNCQLSSLLNAYVLSRLDKITVKEIFQKIKSMGWLKRIILMDIKDEYKSGVIEKMLPICTVIKKKPYTSSNGSKMTILLCFINDKKL